MDMASSNTQLVPGGPNIPHTITPQLAAWITDTR